MAKSKAKKKFVKGSINVDGVSFSKEAVASYGSEAEFIAAPEFAHIFEGNPNREAKLKEVYNAVGVDLGTIEKAPAKEAATKAPAKGGKQ